MKISWGLIYIQSRRCRYRHLLTIILAVLVIFLLLNDRDCGSTTGCKMRTAMLSKVNTEGPVVSVKKENSKKLVLFYTGIFGVSPWPTIENDYQFTNWNNVPCDVQNCRISYDKKDLNLSDAVIFHGQDINGHDLSYLSKTTSNRRSQRWLFYLQESPLSFTHNMDSLEGVFNWTMTYKHDSDIFLPYFYYFSHDKEVSVLENYAKGKSRLVAWVVGNCYASRRNTIVRKLMEYIPVHVYGPCSQKFGQNRTCRRDESCDRMLQKYKFYLALENTDCVDYITEKYWQNSLGRGIVPVVLGGGNYSDKRLAVPGSFINVLDFSSVKDLANYLVMLDKNDTRYNEYFNWRRYYYVGIPAPCWTCQLCSMLNDDTLPFKVYGSGSFQKFWGRKTNCGFQDYKIIKLIA